MPAVPRRAEFGVGPIVSMTAAVLFAACLVAGERPAVAIIVDDLGNRYADDHAAISLPGPIAYGILPFTPLGRSLAHTANAEGREVLLHLPMEADDDNHLLGPGALNMQMNRDDFVVAVRNALADVPHLSGVNNHMGSLLTRDPERMRWLMDEIRTRGGLVYVDSRTTSETAARQAALEANVPYIARDVFLDNNRSPAYIHAQFDRLVALALERGSAVGIGHPYPETTAVLLERLGALERVRLVSLAELRASRACATNRRRALAN